MDKKEFKPLLNFDFKDYLILDIIDVAKGNVGTMKLAELVGLSPKSLVFRINNLFKNGFLDKEIIPLTPSGWKRSWKTNKKGLRMLQLWKDYILGQYKMNKDFP